MTTLRWRDACAIGEDTAQDVLHLEDDEYYRLDFTKMIIVNALLQQEKQGDMEVMTCNPKLPPKA